MELELDIYIRVVVEKVLLHSQYLALFVAVYAVMQMIPHIHVAVRIQRC